MKGFSVGDCVEYKGGGIPDLGRGLCGTIVALSDMPNRAKVKLDDGREYNFAFYALKKVTPKGDER